MMEIPTPSIERPRHANTPTDSSSELSVGDGCWSGLRVEVGVLDERTRQYSHPTCCCVRRLIVVIGVICSSIWRAST